MLDNEPQMEALTAFDRCDRCRAQAFVRATKDRRELLFCLHHIREHVDALMKSDWVLTGDEAYLSILFPEPLDLQKLLT